MPQPRDRLADAIAARVIVLMERMAQKRSYRDENSSMRYAGRAFTRSIAADSAATGVLPVGGSQTLVKLDVGVRGRGSRENEPRLRTEDMSCRKRRSSGLSQDREGRGTCLLTTPLMPHRWSMRKPWGR